MDDPVVVTDGEVAFAKLDVPLDAMEQVVERLHTAIVDWIEEPVEVKCLTAAVSVADEGLAVAAGAVRSGMRETDVNQQMRSGGGGGSRTRVRRHIPVGLYMRVRFFNLATVV